MDDLKKVAERIYHDWDQALSNNDIEALMKLYSHEAIIESPLIPYLLGTEKGICTGHKEIRRLIEAAAARKPLVRKHYRKSFFTDGKTIIWEYPRATSSGDQMDFAEVMEIKDGLIHYHRVYWGWYGVKVLKNDAYHR